VSIPNLDFLVLRVLENEPQMTLDLEGKITLEIHLKKL